MPPHCSTEQSHIGNIIFKVKCFSLNECLYCDDNVRSDITEHVLPTQATISNPEAAGKVKRVRRWAVHVQGS